jgi:hypothetical protein
MGERQVAVSTTVIEPLVRQCQQLVNEVNGLGAPDIVTVQNRKRDEGD